MRALVVDDEAEIRRVVRRALEREQIEVLEAEDAEGAIQQTARARVDVAVLDLHLPGRSGLELLSLLRTQDPDLHVIMLTGAGSESDRVLGLVSGADDYVVKPFSARELAARVIAGGRRRRRPSAAIIEAAGIRIDIEAREATVDGAAVDLTRRELELLAHLASEPGRTFTRGELLKAVWGSSPDWQSEATVTEHVRRLRLKIERDGANPGRIVTVRGTGYRFEGGEDPPPAPAAEADHLARPATERTREAIVVIVDHVIVHANPGALDLVGATDASEVVGRVIFDFVAAQSLGASMARQQSAKEGRWPRPEVITLVRNDGEEVLVEIASTPVRWNGSPASQVSLWDLAGDTSKLRELATGIRTDVTDAVIIMDAQQRIQSFNGAAEVLYGWREDEVRGRSWAEVLPPLSDEATAQAAYEAMEQEGRWQGEFVLRRRDGSALTVRSSATLLKDGSGQTVGVISVNRPVEQAMNHGVVERPSLKAALDDEIRRGIEQREFVVHYQPVVRLDDGSWTGVEALVRWQHPRRGLLAPSAFIDAAERSGAIIDLGQLVLDEAARQWRIWCDAGSVLRMGVNMSGRQLADPTLTDRVAAAMASASMPAGALWLEVTETSLVADLDGASNTLRDLTDLGARISIDDFGTGWASLTYLRQFPVHALKIDRLFVDGLEKSVTDSAIVSSIISLGAELDLSVIAEGIETTRQAARLRELGCALGQGYLYSKPRPAAELDSVPR